MGAKKVWEGDRVFTTFDTKEHAYLKSDRLIRLTEEGKLKLSVSTNTSKSSVEEKETVKVFVSRKQEMIDFFEKLDIYPICEVSSYRISYELETNKGTVDFDIDLFPLLTPFLEIDLEYLEGTLDSLLEQLHLKDHICVTMGTEQVYEREGINYFQEFSLEK